MSMTGVLETAAAKRRKSCQARLQGTSTLTPAVPSDRLWQCGDCKQTGTLDVLMELDCPQGKAPVLRDLPQEIVLVSEDRDAYIARAKISRHDDYSDPLFVKLMDMPQRSFDFLRRMGALDRVMWTAHSKIDDGYIGLLKDADKLAERGIVPQRSHPDHNVCSIGFCDREQAWYGWSHRATYGFTVGYVAAEGDLVTTTGYIESYILEHPEKDRSVPVGFECKTLEDCKRCAIAFADSVG